MRRASWISLGMIVTLLAWIAQRFVSSNKPTRYASAASWSASTAWLWNLKSVLKSWAISRTNRWNGSLRIRSSVLFWYFLISLLQTQIDLDFVHQIRLELQKPYRRGKIGVRVYRRATVPGRYRWGFFTPPVVGADFLAAFKTKSKLTDQ